jgi:short-subunit dehydrogenase involved in D-alanine esterification of teichoic acids
MDAQTGFRVDGLTVVITGGGTGIGLILTKALASNGAAAVYILGINPGPLEDAAKISVRTRCPSPQAVIEPPSPISTP